VAAVICRIKVGTSTLVALASGLLALSGCHGDGDDAPVAVNPAGGAEYKIIDLGTGGVTDAPSVPDLETNDAYKTTHLVLKRIPAGTFQMGDQVGGHDGDELPVHTVNITQAFYMGVFELTQEQWTAIVGSWTFYWPGYPKRPAEQVSWNDINGPGGFMDTLSSRASLSFRLPTEAEWEYCCKAGTSTNYSYGDTASGAWMWYYSNSGSQTHDVGTTTSKPNPWGLYDLHGNVYEWCEDRYGSSYYSSSPSDDPMGPASGSSRVLRGGPWDAFDDNSRSAFRGSIDPAWRDYHFGFRVAAAGP
jgi:formylglycine-generating enzyme required for sulfatase activity